MPAHGTMSNHERTLVRSDESSSCHLWGPDSRHGNLNTIALCIHLSKLTALVLVVDVIAAVFLRVQLPCRKEFGLAYVAQRNTTDPSYISCPRYKSCFRSDR